MQSQTVLEERSVRSTSPSLLTATVGQRVLSQLDDGSGCTSPERVIALWTEEGIRNSRDILQVWRMSCSESSGSTLTFQTIRGGSRDADPAENRVVDV
eukprot:superscaffoldBa00011271_g25132